MAWPTGVNGEGSCASRKRTAGSSHRPHRLAGKLDREARRTCSLPQEREWSLGLRKGVLVCADPAKATSESRSTWDTPAPAEIQFIVSSPLGWIKVVRCSRTSCWTDKQTLSRGAYQHPESQRMPSGFDSKGPPVKRIDLPPPSPAFRAETTGPQGLEEGRARGDSQQELQIPKSSNADFKITVIHVLDTMGDRI